MRTSAPPSSSPNSLTDSGYGAPRPLNDTCTGEFRGPRCADFESCGESVGTAAMGSLKSPTIRSSTTVLVSPESPTPPENRRLVLSILDSSEICIFTPVILLYAPPQQQGEFAFQALVASLKDSLRKALVAYYPFAGRLVTGESGLAEVRCDDSGAFFTDVVVEEELAEIGGSERCVALSGMEAAKLSSEGIHSLDEYGEIPPLVIQVTSFKCKSVALAVNWHHQVVDGISGMTFLKSWSELAQGLPITNLPDHRRHLLQPREELQPVDFLPGYKLLSAQPEERDSMLPSEERWSKDENIGIRAKKAEFTISPSDIQQLKKQAAEEGSNNSTAFASGVLISAHLWRLVTRARGLNREAATRLYTIVDARKRLKDFPLNYFGNCIFVRPADSLVADILDKPLAHVAKLIHDSVSVVTDDYVRSIVDYLHVTGPSNLAWDRPNLATHDLQLTFWRFFPIYELDFGFGVPSFGGRNSATLGSAGFAAVCPTPAKDGSVLIVQYLHADAAVNLEELLKSL